MDPLLALERKAGRAAEAAARSVLMQATQMLRQFHRIGKSRTAGCRKGLLKLCAEHLRDLRRQLVSTAVELTGGDADTAAVAAVIGDALAATTDQFAAEFSDLLQSMEGATPADLADLRSAAVEEVRPELEEALFDRGDAAAVPDTGFVSDDRLRHLATTLATEAVRPGSRAAAFMAAAALAAVLQDALGPRPAPHRARELLASARTRGLVPASVVDDGQWTTRRGHLLDPDALLLSPDPVDAEEAAALLELLHALCDHLRQ
jgi:hypothetical protein